MSEAAEKAAEKAAEMTADVVENAEEVIDGVVEVVEVARNNVPLLIGVFVAGVAGGAGLGYLLASRKLGKEFDARMEKEIELVRVSHRNLEKTDDDGNFLTPQQAFVAHRGAEALSQYQGRSAENPSDDPDGQPEGEPYDHVRDEEMVERLMDEAADRMRSREKETRNVFVEAEDPNFNLEAEKLLRRPETPYVISLGEYLDSLPDQEMRRLTYYEVDDVLANENDETIEIDENIGDGAVIRFGHGSGKPDTVFIRNEKQKTDYEVVRSTGSYLEEVLGMPEQRPDQPS